MKSELRDFFLDDNSTFRKIEIVDGNSRRSMSVNFIKDSRMVQVSMNLTPEWDKASKKESHLYTNFERWDLAQLVLQHINTFLKIYPKVYVDIRDAYRGQIEDCLDFYFKGQE